MEQATAGCIHGLHNGLLWCVDKVAISLKSSGLELFVGQKHSGVW